MTEIEITVARDGFFPWYWSATGRGITRVGTFRWDAIYRWKHAYRRERQQQAKKFVRHERVKVKP